MPLTIKQNGFKFKDSNDDYVGVDVIAETTLTEQIAAVEGEGATQVAAVQAKGTEVINSIPSDYTELTEEVDDLKSALTNIQDYYKNPNLFDGHYIHGKYLGGAHATLETNANYYTMIIDIEPNTTYTIWHEPVEKEDNYYWFKVATDKSHTAQQLINATGNVSLDGDIYDSWTNTSRLSYTFTTGADEKVFCATVSKYTQPYAELTEGTHTSQQYSSYKDSIVPNGIGVYSKNEVKELMGKNYFSVSSGNMSIKCGKVFIDFRHINWSGKKVNTYIIYQGSLTEGGSAIFDYDIEGPILEQGAADFIGGGHGYEQMSKITVIADGEEVDLTQTISHQEYDILSVYIESTLCHYGTETPCFDRNKSLIFQNGHVEIHNVMKATDAFDVNRYCAHGLMSAYCDILIGYVANNRNKLEEPDTTQTTAQQIIDYTDTLTSGILYEDGVAIRIEPLENNYKQYEEGGLYGFYADQRKRIKFYFDAIHTHGTPVSLAVNDVLRAGFVIHFD